MFSNISTEPFRGIWKGGREWRLAPGGMNTASSLFPIYTSLNILNSSKAILGTAPDLFLPVSGYGQGWNALLDYGQE